ncbi:MAG TPA: hypothetical protein VKB42_16115, partial [Dongiaceae bacterium]|nr:hypothetical protein [Dongiaceae bacterium]
VRFCLRGIGLTEEAIERYCNGGPGTVAAIAGAMKKHPTPGTEAEALSVAAAMATSHDGPEEHRAAAEAAGRAR